jgi:hypothetical protein
MLAARACAFLFSLIFYSKMKKMQSPIIFMICLISLHGSIALSHLYYVYLGPIARNVCVIVVIGWSYSMGCNAHLLFSVDREKDRTLPNLMFMLF